LRRDHQLVGSSCRVWRAKVASAVVGARALRSCSSAARSWLAGATAQRARGRDPPPPTLKSIPDRLAGTGIDSRRGRERKGSRFGGSACLRTAEASSCEGKAQQAHDEEQGARGGGMRGAHSATAT